MIKTGERSQLRINEGFARAWRLTGVALDRVGFAVEDRDRSSGIYFVRYNELSGVSQEEKGFFSRLAFWRDDEDSIDNGNPPNFFTPDDVGDNNAEIGVRDVLPFFAANIGATITLHTGEVGDEGGENVEPG